MNLLQSTATPARVSNHADRQDVDTRTRSIRLPNLLTLDPHFEPGPNRSGVKMKDSFPAADRHPEQDWPHNAGRTLTIK